MGEILVWQLPDGNPSSNHEALVVTVRIA